MSKMFDYVVNGGDKVAELEASLEHMGGHLEIEIEENRKLRAENERMRAAFSKMADAWTGSPLTARETAREEAQRAALLPTPKRRA
jgi:regulator of replication initiation timing